MREHVPAFTERWVPAAPGDDAILVHGDIHSDHLYGAGEPWLPCALIDFGDARASNAFYELGALQMGMFDADRGQLAAFLDGYGWDTGDGAVFARGALATALLHDFDLFSEHRALLAGANDLDALAELLFAP